MGCQNSKHSSGVMSRVGVSWIGLGRLKDDHFVTCPYYCSIIFTSDAYFFQYPRALAFSNFLCPGYYGNLCFSLPSPEYTHNYPSYCHSMRFLELYLLSDLYPNFTLQESRREYQNGGSVIS